MTLFSLREPRESKEKLFSNGGLVLLVTAPLSNVLAGLPPLPWPLLLPDLDETEAEHHQWSVRSRLCYIHGLRFNSGNY